MADGKGASSERLSATARWLTGCLLVLAAGALIVSAYGQEASVTGFGGRGATLPFNPVPASIRYLALVPAYAASSSPGWRCRAPSGVA